MVSAGATITSVVKTQERERAEEGPSPVGFC